MQAARFEQHCRQIVKDYRVWEKEYRSYLTQLIGEYDTLIPNNAQSPAVAVASEIKTRFLDPQRTQSITVDDVNTFELAMLKLESFAMLKRQAWELRHRFRDVAGEVLYTAYLEENQRKPSDKATEVDEETLRADLESILCEIHRLNRNIPGRERLRRGLTLRVAVVAFVIVMIALSLVIVCSQKQISSASAWALHSLPVRTRVEDNLMMGALAIIGGSIGGFISVQRRLQQISSQTSFLALWHGKTSLYMGPVGGAIFAIVFYLLCLSGLLGTDSTLLPSTQGGINNVKDVAKLLIGGFIAGFAEQFIPDILNRVVAKQQSSENPNSTN